jgi:hypothetical protein
VSGRKSGIDRLYERPSENIKPNMKYGEQYYG